ncbi:hypothetical protein AB0O76_40545 [Streptomyces sp. NPDC086554]|uniref:hypothetical protein n=1 Tax=Streptomyces sp. NPDC086554 TaxID=3154864 RepID=UPI003432F95C
MARRMVEQITCDGCAAKDKQREAVTTLQVQDDTYDLCQEHADRFAAYFADLFGQAVTNTAAA